MVIENDRQTRFAVDCVCLGSTFGRIYMCVYRGVVEWLYMLVCVCYATRTSTQVLHRVLRNHVICMTVTKTTHNILAEQAHAVNLILPVLGTIGLVVGGGVKDQLQVYLSCLQTMFFRESTDQHPMSAHA